MFSITSIGFSVYFGSSSTGGGGTTSSSTGGSIFYFNVLSYGTGSMGSSIYYG